jgi:hypothetical protein
MQMGITVTNQKLSDNLHNTEYILYSEIFIRILNDTGNQEMYGKEAIVIK